MAGNNTVALHQIMTLDTFIIKRKNTLNITNNNISNLKKI